MINSEVALQDCQTVKRRYVAANNLAWQYKYLNDEKATQIEGYVTALGTVSHERNVYFRERGELTKENAELKHKLSGAKWWKRITITLGLYIAGREIFG